MGERGKGTATYLASYGPGSEKKKKAMGTPLGGGGGVGGGGWKSEKQLGLEETDGRH